MEPKEKAKYNKTGKLPKKFLNYAKAIATSQNIDTTNGKFININMKKFIQAVIKQEGGAEALKHFTDKIISDGIVL